MKRLAALTLVLVLTAATGYAAYRYLPAIRGLSLQARDALVPSGSDAQPRSLIATGLIEARTTTVSGETGGQVKSLRVEDGDGVISGQLLATLDDSLVRAQIAQADAVVAEAQAQLDLLLAGARPEEIAHGKALVAQAEVASQVAQERWEDAELLRDNPQEMDVQIIEAETTAAKAEHEATAARIQAEAADLQVEFWGRVTEILGAGFDVPLPNGTVLHVDRPAERDEANTQWNLAGQQAWEAWQAAYAAEEAVRAANTALADLRQQRSTPIALDSQVNQAEAAYNQAQAALGQSRAGLDALEEGPSPEQVEIARQVVQQAKAGRAALDVSLEKTHIRAPQGGLVSRVTVRAGEVMLPGTPLLEILDLSQLTLTVFVPEPEIGRVWLGQAVEVSVDSFPSRVFPGTVTRIADRAEFTPKNVYIPEQRVDTVFAVEIALDNLDGALRPGMPADAAFAES